MNPKRLEKLPWREIDGRAVVLQPQQGQIHELNSVASFLWSSASGELELDKIVQALVENFEIDSETATLDAKEFYEELRNCGLIAPVANTNTNTNTHVNPQ